MNEETEALLSAYLDGALSQDEAGRVERMAARDPTIAEALERLRANDQQLRSALDEGIDDEADQTTLRLFGIGQPSAVRTRDLAPSLRQSVNDNKRSWAWPAAGAIAASVALLVIMRPAAPLDPWSTPQFSQALDSTASLQTASLPRGATLSPKLTFVAGDGRYCREFSLRAANPAQGRDGIACRSVGDRWHTVSLVKANGAAVPGSGIDVAQGPGEQLDAAYAKLRASDPLSADRERTLIANHWPAAK